jgi:hypothetical protein
MSNPKQTIYRQKGLRRVVTPFYRMLRRSGNFNSKAYWEQRYKQGGNSGGGSYGRLAEYKAEFLNAFAKNNDVTSVIEFGSGDGAQLKLFNFTRYTGLDVSKTSIGLCIDQYGADKSKSFYVYDPEYFLDNQRRFAGDLTMSLDVIYHLIEDAVFDKYMRDLFAASDRYVIIYASNTDQNARGQAQHVRHRRFTDWVETNQKNWKLIEQAKNKYSLETDPIDGTFADFYVYQRIE